MNANEQELKILDQPDYFEMWQAAELRIIALTELAELYRLQAEMNADTIRAMTAAKYGRAH
jgi:hypothetical protein